MVYTLASSDSQLSWLSFFTALCVVEAFMLINFRLFPNFWGNMINIWYDKFGLVAIMLDMLHRPKRKMRQKLTLFFDNVIAPLQA